MAVHSKLTRLQTTALIVRTYHWQRRQYCSLLCNFIFPGLLLVLLSFLNRIIRPAKFSVKPFELRPKGGFVARPFDVANCGKLVLLYGDSEKVRDICEKDPFVPSYVVPTYAHPSIASEIGQHDAVASAVNIGLMSTFSLDPFAYKPAFDPNSQFYHEKTPYDSVFEDYLFRTFSSFNIDLPREYIAAMVLHDKFDRAYDSYTKPLASRQQLFQDIYDEWFKGGAFFSYSTALAFDSFTRNSDGLSLTATIFFNSTFGSKCLYYCSHVSSVVRLYNSIYQSLDPDKFSFTYLRRMPHVNPYDDFGLIQLIIGMLIGLLAHFLFPTFLRFLVLERVSRLRAMMASMGLRRVQYWFGTYISLLIVYIVAMTFIIVVGGNVLIALAMSMEPFFQSPETAQTVGWLFVFLVNLIGGPFIARKLANGRTSERSWTAIMVLPSFAFMRSVYRAGVFNSGGEGVTLNSKIVNNYDLRMCGPHGPFCRSFTFLAIEWVVLLVLASYFDRVFSGARLHPLFFLGFKRRVDIRNVVASDHDFEEDDSSAYGPDVLEQHVWARSIVENMEREKFDGVVLYRLSKLYPGRKPVCALQQLSLVAQRGDVFCIVAHNGAGKTTAFRILVGEIEATFGVGFVCGHSITTEMQHVHCDLGVAAQQDILWEDLTVLEHLCFYARAKNLSGKQLHQAVNDALRCVQLEFAQNRKVSKLSGGMKRRLSVGIAFIGGPSCIVLDEPTTGLDIRAREMLWKTIERMKDDRVILLTTHSLEEAEALGTKVAVMSQGKLRCVGTAQELKLRLGRGHRLTVSLPESYIGSLHEEIFKVAPGTTIESVILTTVEYLLPKEVRISLVVGALTVLRSTLNIRDWDLTESSLEDVFMRITKDDTEL